MTLHTGIVGRKRTTYRNARYCRKNNKNWTCLTHGYLLKKQARENERERKKERKKKDNLKGSRS